MIDAATVLLLRRGDHGAEVLLVQRHPALSFMGGLWAFPGGRVERADGEAAARDGDSAADAAFRVAACRELHEECAVELRPAELQPWARWITPSAAVRRYDTRFYATRITAATPIRLDAAELVAYQWLEPAAAVRRARAGALPVSPPTLWMLEDLRLSLATHGTLDGMLAAERTRAIPPIMPRLRATIGGAEAVMPWEADYCELPGDGAAIDAGSAPYLARLAALPTRRNRSALIPRADPA